MREHHAFWQTGRAAGIRQRHQIFARIDLDARNIAVTFQQRIEWRGAFGFAKDEQLFNLCLLRGRASLVGKLWRGDQKLGAGVAQLMRRLFGGVERIHRGINAAEHGYGVKSHAVLGTIRAEDSKDVALLKPSLRQARGCASH